MIHFHEHARQLTFRVAQTGDGVQRALDFGGGSIGGNTQNTKREESCDPPFQWCSLKTLHDRSAPACAAYCAGPLLAAVAAPADFGVDR